MADSSSHKKKRANGQGSISFVPSKGRWLVRFHVNTDPDAVTRQSIYVRTEEEAEALLRGTLNGWHEDIERGKIAAITKRHDAACYVYFIQALGGGPIKIGTTNDVQKRFSTIQGNSPVLLRVLHIMPGDRKAEREIHRKFGPYRLWGEWFGSSREILDYIKSLKAI